MIIIAFFKALGLMYILTRLPDWLFRRILGHALWADLFFTLILPIPFIITGTLGGAVLAVFLGIFMSMFLTIARNVGGYEAYDRASKTWVAHPGKWATRVKQLWSEVTTDA